MLRRRELLGGVALAGAAGAFGIARLLPRGDRPGVLVYDSARPLSRAFARAGQAVRRIDLAAEARTNWAGLRSLGRALPVAGLTGWSAYVAARGCLEAQGLRLVSEVVDRRHGLIAWRMA